MLTYSRKNNDWSCFSHAARKLPLSVLLMAATWHNAAAQLVAVLPNCQFFSHCFRRISMQVAGLFVASVTFVASCNTTSISWSSGVNDIALMRPVSCSTGVNAGAVVAAGPTWTQSQSIHCSHSLHSVSYCSKFHNLKNEIPPTFPDCVQHYCLTYLGYTYYQ